MRFYRSYVFGLKLFMRTRIKVCGLTCSSDASAAVHCGVDALGLIFFSGSSRCVETAVASEIAQEVSGFAMLIAVFVDAKSFEIENVLAKVPVNMIQFHGSESLEECERFEVPYIKTLRMSQNVSLDRFGQSYPSARAILLDTYQPNNYGGTGEAFSWDLAADYSDKRIVVAGGLKATNVSDAIVACQPYAVDVSTGVELSPGVKDRSKIDEFVAAVNACDQGLKSTKKSLGVTE